MPAGTEGPPKSRDASQHSISWLELAIDFQAATHAKLCQPNDDAGEYTAESQARLFAAATKRMALICKDSAAQADLVFLSAPATKTPCRETLIHRIFCPERRDLRTRS